MKILLEEHIPNFIKNGTRYYCRHIIVESDSRTADSLRLYENTDCVFTEEQMRAAESIPSDVELSDGTGKQFEWRKVGPDQRLNRGEDLEVWIMYHPAKEWSDLYYERAKL
jgi:hypothetical protein